MNKYCTWTCIARQYWYGILQIDIHVHEKIFCRFSRNFKDSNGTEFRTLYKAYGVKFVISVSGQARKFAPVPFFTVVGSGLALLSIVSLWYLSFGIICCWNHHCFEGISVCGFRGLYLYPWCYITKNISQSN